MSNKHISYLFWILVTVLPIVGIALALLDAKSFADAQATWQGRIAIFGIFAPLAFIALQALQVVITPISHYSLGVVGGFLFGPYWGAILNWTGRMIGHMTAYFIARSWARPLAERFVSPETITKYDRLISKQSLSLFLMYFLPIFPDDELSYLAGLSKMRFRLFFFANFFGHVGGSLGLAYIGSGIDTKDPLFWVLFISTLLGFPLVWYLFRRAER